MAAFYGSTTNATSAWEWSVYEGTATTTNFLQYPSTAVYSNYPTATETVVVVKTKAMLQREAMRAYLARFPHAERSERRPCLPVRAMVDPLRHHRRRQFRLTPRRPGIGDVT